MAELRPKSLYERIMEATTDSEIREISDFMLLSKIRCHLPCKVLSVDYNNGTVDVEIQGKQDMGYGAYEKFPILSDIPILEPHRTSRAYIITPLKSGDSGLLEFLDFNCSNYNSDGNTEPTLDPELHSINSSVFINGYIPQSNVIDTVIKNTELTKKSNNPTMLVEPTLDLYNRPQVVNEDGSYSTTASVTINTTYKGQEAFAVIPTVYNNAHHTIDEAIEQFNKTGEHFGIFTTEDISAVEKYSEEVHNAQAEYIATSGDIQMGLYNNMFTFNVDSVGNLRVKCTTVNNEAENEAYTYAKKVIIEGDNITISGNSNITITGGNISISGNTTIDNKNFLTHTHSNGNQGNPTGGVL